MSFRLQPLEYAKYLFFFCIVLKWLISQCQIIMIFSAACIIRMSRLCHEHDVCLSVRNVGELSSHIAVRCKIFDPARKGNHSSFLTPTVVGG